MSPAWLPRLPVTHEGVGSKLTASRVATAVEGGCPAALAAQSRGVWPDYSGSWTRTKDPRSFFNGVLLAAVREAERGDLPAAEAVRLAVEQEHSRGTPPLHPGLACYAEHAVAAYLAATAEERRAVPGRMPLHPSNERVIDEVDGPTVTCWGLWYETADRRYREVRRLRQNGLRPVTDADRVWAAVAAKVAVDGRRLNAARPDPDPARVRVRELSGYDGESRVLWVGTADEARATYAQLVAPRLTRILDGVSLEPGWGCGGCAWVGICPAIPRVDGLLGQPGIGPWTRSLAASDLDAYDRCPAMYTLLREAHLPRGEQTVQQTRGRAVHQWLEVAHDRPGHPVCSLDDLPDPASGDLGLADGFLSREDYRIAHPYLVQHAAACPLGEPGLRDVEPERGIRAFDGHADVLVVAKPDLTFTASTATPVWWEVKTTDRALPSTDPYEAIERYPAVALDLLMIAAGLPDQTELAERERNGILLLDVLGPDDHVRIELDITDEALLSTARRIIAERVYPWHQDQTFAAAPSRGCEWCPALSWCPDGQAHLAGRGPAAPTPGDLAPDDFVVGSDHNAPF